MQLKCSKAREVQHEHAARQGLTVHIDCTEDNVVFFLYSIMNKNNLVVIVFPRVCLGLSNCNRSELSSDLLKD